MYWEPQEPSRNPLTIESQPKKVKSRFIIKSLDPTVIIESWTKGIRRTPQGVNLDKFKFVQKNKEKAKAHNFINFLKSPFHGRPPLCFIDTTT